MNAIFIAAVASLALAGCSTTGTMKATDALSASYVGTKADDFFLKYGPPHSTHELDSGSKMYLWAENATVYNLGGGIFNSRQTLATNAPVQTNPGSMAVQCEVRIVASAGGDITQMAVQNDTIGKWQLSRCHELFVE